MANVIRYFSTASAGAADGTTWADRAALLSSGTFSTVITGFNFSGSDGLEVRIGPGTYTVTTLLQTSSFANPPTAANPIMFHGCDSSGNLLAVPNAAWTSDMPTWDDSGLPVIATTTNVQAISGAIGAWSLRLLKFTASGRTGGTVIGTIGVIDWVSIVNSTANASTSGITTSARYTNCQVSMTGSSYNFAISSNGNAEVKNCKAIGVAGSSGNRDGFVQISTTALVIFDMCCASGFGGNGLNITNTSVGVLTSIFRSVFANNGGAGILCPSTASQTAQQLIQGCCITGNTGIGINANSACHVVALNNRLRNNSSNLSGFGNYQDYDTYTTAATDADDYNNAGSNDFRIRASAGFANRNIGVSQMATNTSPNRGIRTGGRL